MDSHETDLSNEENDIEQWLESELDVDEGELRPPPQAPLPSKIRWIVSDGATVVVNQALATFSPIIPSSKREETQQPGGLPGQNDSIRRDAQGETPKISSLSLESPDDNSTEEPRGTLEQKTEEVSCNTFSQDAQPYGDNTNAITPGTHEGSETHRQPIDGACILRSPCHGTLSHYIHTDTVITDPTIVLCRIESAACNHSIVIHGLCINCCQAVEDHSQKRPRNSSPAALELHAPEYEAGGSPGMVVPGFITSDNAVRVHASVSNEMELLEILNLLRKRKLCLVLDLDNTLIHSSCNKAPDDIDMPVIDMYSSSNGYKQEYDEEIENLRYENDLENSILITKTLNEVDCRYFINYYKLRPGVYDFLRQASQMYELYLFTMGTRAHAHAALKILDPKGVYFGNRIFSRSEARNSVKSLSRIFPNYRNLLLILDDSEHIWENSPGIIKVHPYYYFPAMNLVRTRDYIHIGRVSAALQAACNYSNYIWPSTIMDLWREHELMEGIARDDDGFTIPMSMVGPRQRRGKFRYNSLLIANQRPSSIFRDTDDCTPSSNSRELHTSVSSGRSSCASRSRSSTSRVEPPTTEDALDELSISPCEEANADGGVGLSEPTSVTPRERHVTFSLSSTTSTTLRKIRKVYVKDSDRQLAYMVTLLTEMHKQFYNGFDTTDLSLPKLKTLIEEKRLPDVGPLLKEHRRNLLKGVVLYVKRSDFRGPHTDENFDFLSHSDLGITARQFGAIPHSATNPATHYINNNTSTVAPRADVKKVHSQWLEACIYTWTHANEARFDSDKWSEPFRTFWDVLDS
ncbi:protein phosphatase family protein [Babesia divergens]|uniref:RNA polymerase II subunit A C-terminal domain phosphatase n=1 Tax=Babesia divergens TaxID=32595 RepID=A0AAD9GEK2_BABDI|nr:protein phosphatase family protein [Babesia divergens]